MAFWNLSRRLAQKMSAFDRSQAVIEFDMGGVILDANRNFLDTVGYNLGEIKGRHHSMFVGAAVAQSDSYRAFWEKLGRGEFDAGEYRRLGKGGREVWIQASYNPVLGGGGKPYKVIKLATDVTARKLADAETGGQLQAIGKSQAVIHFNLDGTILDANQNFLDGLGYSLSEIKGKHHSLFIDPAYAQSEEYRAFWKKLARGEYDAGEYKRFGKGGREIWIQASYNPILDASGRPFKVVKFATDITRQKLAAADTNGQIAAIGQSYAVIHFNLDGTIITANKNFLAATGYSLDEVAGHHHSMFVDKAYAASREYQEFWTRLRAGKFDSNEYRRFGKGGRELWIQASYNPIFDMNGTPFKVVKYATDITTSMQARSAVAGLVERSTVNVQGMASAAEEMSASINEISGSVTRSRSAVDDIVNKIGAAGASSESLRTSSETMGKIVGFIRDIADKVNLLALNATIEAARAGEAGRGFTVVASEVKALAKQTAEATNNISAEIQAMLTISGRVADTVSEAVRSADLVSECVSQVAGAVTQQSVATRDISSSAQNAADALADINTQVKKIASR